MKIRFTFFLFLFIHFSFHGQNELLTTAERTNYERTSTYDEVMNFIKELEKQSKYIRLETIATTIEGREIPLMVVGNPLPERFK